MKLSKAQETALIYYRNLADKTGARKMKYNHDPRPIAKLCELGFLALVGHHFGPVHAITDAGRAYLKDES